MEAQGDPFRRGLPTLQTSLTLPELPCTATAGLICKISLAFGAAVAVQGSFWADWEVRGGKQCGFALVWWGNEMRISPSSVAYGAKLLAVFFPLEGEGFYTLCDHSKYNFES